MAGYTAKVQQQVTDSTDWTGLVDKIAAGPPLHSPFKVLDPLVNVAEMFIHNEDVRCAQPGWEPKVLDTETAKALSWQVTTMARMAMAKPRRRCR